MKKMAGMLGGKEKNVYNEGMYSNNVGFLMNNTGPLMAGLSNPALDMGGMAGGLGGIGGMIELATDPVAAIKKKLTQALDLPQLMDHLKYLGLHCIELVNPSPATDQIKLKASVAYLGMWAKGLPLKLKGLDLKEYGKAAKYVANNMDTFNKAKK